MKPASTLFSALALLGALLAGLFYYLAESESEQLRRELTQTRSQLEETERQRTRLDSEATDLEASLSTKVAALEETQANATLLNARNSQLRRESMRLGEELEERIAHEESLRRTIADLETQLAETRANSVSLDQIADYEATIERLEAQALRLAETRPGNPSSEIDFPTSSSEPPPDLSGEILTVGPGSSFVVLNLGYLNGIRLDHRLAIKRDSEPVADVRVTEVKENLSIGQILPNSLTKEPRQGDKVTTNHNRSNL